MTGPRNRGQGLRGEDLAAPMAALPPEMPPPPGDADAPGGGTPPPLRILDPCAWGEEDPPPVRYLLEGLLPMGVPAILAATSNAGKSLLGMMITFSVATGWPLFGRQGAKEPMKALFVEMEDDPDEIQRRFRRCRDLFREDPAWGPTHEALLKANWRAAVPEWTSATPKSITVLLPFLQAHADVLCRDGGKLGLVVLDTFAALSEGEENKAEVQRAFWAACFTLSSATGATLLVIHHVRKPGTGSRGKGGPSMAERLSFDALRGSSAIVAGARAILQAEPLTVEEAARLGLDEERAAAGNFIILALTKTISGPKGAWLALEQREAWENGAGFFVPMKGGDHVCASLRGKAAAAKLNLAESVLLSLAGGCEDRKELARRHWPAETEEKAAASLKSMMNALRSRLKWVQKGKSLALTWEGTLMVKQLKGTQEPQGVSPVDDSDEESHQGSGSQGGHTVSLAVSLEPTGTEQGMPAAPQSRLAPQVPQAKGHRDTTPRRGESVSQPLKGEVI